MHHTLMLRCSHVNRMTMHLSPYKSHWYIYIYIYIYDIDLTGYVDSYRSIRCTSQNNETVYNSHVSATYGCLHQLCMTLTGMHV